MADELKTELLTDPEGRGYSGLSDEDAAADLNTAWETRDRELMSASEVYNAIDQTGWSALTGVQQQEVWDILHLGDVNPFGREATRFIALFGAGSATLIALAAARVEAITRAQKLGIPTVKGGHVEEARR